LLNVLATWQNGGNWQCFHVEVIKGKHLNWQRKCKGRLKKNLMFLVQVFLLNGKRDCNMMGYCNPHLNKNKATTGRIIMGEDSSSISEKHSPNNQLYEEEILDEDGGSKKRTMFVDDVGSGSHGC
jgi:hypothetical protein